ncbi:MAG TPA: DNA primase catalytic subunit PriS [Thermoplasmata archaeon]|jgi:DNA primase small subunit|nr:MAG TPA: DNA primase catalytic subunit PriS [Thermoplasmata archaeon]
MGDENSIQRSIEFLKNSFQTYYASNKVVLPDRFGRREFAFILFGGKGMVRHLGFEKREMIWNFFTERAPQHAYYSSAYYQHPDAAKMTDKIWMGAELIFDLDSDHLPNAEKMGYVESLIEVKKEFIKLIDEFLLGDFGFKEKHMELYFSGGRGYHCHVKDTAILDLDSNERREIVDYITGRDLQDSIIFHEQATGRKSYGGHSFASGKSLKMPTPDQDGWKGRISRGIIELVNEIKKSDNPEKKLEEYGVNARDAERLVQDLSEERVQRIKDGMLDQSKTIRKFFLNSALRKTAVSLSAGETDEPVTCDVKRLIRLPSSLHGKTGLKVVKIDVDDLKDFDPLRDAVVLPEDPVQINVHREVNMDMNNQNYHLGEGKQEVPTYLAVLLIGRKEATLV